MTDQASPSGDLAGQGVTPSDTQNTGNGQTPIASLPPDIQKYIDDLRKEAEGHRLAQRAAESAAKQAEEKRLAEQQEWQKLAEARKADLDKLKPVADQYDVITAAFNASLDQRMKNIPDDVRRSAVDPIRAALSPVDFSNWLDANAAILSPRRAPNMDAGAGSSVGKPTTLTPEQIQMSQWLQMTPEQYAKQLADLKAKRGE